VARVTHMGDWHGSAGMATARATAWAARCSGTRRRTTLRLLRWPLTLRDLVQQVEGMDTLVTEACGGRCCGAVQKLMMAGGAGGRDSWGKLTQRDSEALGSLDRLGWFLGRRRVG
jgi:hypothetical protein